MSERFIVIATAWLVLCHLDLPEATPLSKNRAEGTPENCVSFESSYHIERGCQCLVFESQGENQGTYSSPNFPFPYPGNITCLLITFIADIDEIIQVTFNHFDLTPPHDNECLDYIRLYLDLDRPEISDPKKVNYNLCGSLDNLSQKTFYSSKRSFILEFHSSRLPRPPQRQTPESPRPTSEQSLTPVSLPRFHQDTTQHEQNRTGFQISYHFWNKTKFELEGGTKRFDERCVYDFYSSRASKSGRFFSPLYPQRYPPNTSCFYVFHARQDERTTVKFLFVRMSRSGSNRKYCSGDYLKVYDGDLIITKAASTASATPAASVPTTSGRILGVLCGLSGEDGTVTSLSENMVIEFTSGAKVGPGEGSFGASFQFAHKDTLILSAPQSERPSDTVRIASTHPEDSRMTSSSSSSECKEEFISLHNKTGFFTSPHYPKPYPVPSKCRYIFRGQSQERIQIYLTEFSSGNRSRKTKEINSRSRPGSCGGEDTLAVSVLISGQSRIIAMFCGSNDVSKLPLMSNDNHMELLFTTSADQGAKMATGGFKGRYHFVTDFGIKFGDRDKEKGCYFQYHSSRYKNGTVTSPNHPGLYPRSTECFYYFHGSKEERVVLQFLKFDIEGVPPSCLPDTQSDYLEYTDSSLPLLNDDVTTGNKLCGTGAPEMQNHVIISEGSFLKLTFASNDLYDATGFRAQFFFKNKGDIQPNQRKRIVASSIKSSRSGGSGFFVVATTTTSSLSVAIFHFSMSTVTMATTVSHRTISSS